MVMRNFGAQGTAIGAIESRLPAGLGGLAPCNPPAPTFSLRKTTDEATGIVTSAVVILLSAAMMRKYGAGQWRLLLSSCSDKDELNNYRMKFGDYTDFEGDYGVQVVQYDITEGDIANGYVEIGNDRMYFAASLQFLPDGSNPLYEYSQLSIEGLYPLRSVWSLNPYGMLDASGTIFASRPLVTYDGTGYFAHVVAPVGTVVVDVEDSHKAEVWLPADGKRHEVRTTVGFWGKNIYLTKDNIILCDKDTFVSDSDVAVVDFTSFVGDKGVAVYAATQAEAQMQQLVADAVTAGKAVIDVNPGSSISDLGQYEEVTFVDPGGLSNQSDGLVFDNNINGGCYRIRVIGKAPKVEIEEGVFARNYETERIVGMTVGDVSGYFSANYATVESMTVGDVSGDFYANYATVESMTVGDVGGVFYADYATVESMTVGDCGDFSASSSTVESMTVGDCGNFYADYATVESMTVGDCGDFSANSATVESMTVGDCGGFSANSSTVQSMTLNVTQNIESGDVTEAQFGAIYVPASLVSDFKTTSIFAGNADIIYPISA